MASARMVLPGVRRQVAGSAPVLQEYTRFSTISMSPMPCFSVQFHLLGVIHRKTSSSVYAGVGTPFSKAHGRDILPHPGKLFGIRWHKQRCRVGFVKDNPSAPQRVNICHKFSVTASCCSGESVVSQAVSAVCVINCLPCGTGTYNSYIMVMCQEEPLTGTL